MRSELRRWRDGAALLLEVYPHGDAWKIANLRAFAETGVWHTEACQWGIYDRVWKCVSVCKVPL